MKKSKSKGNSYKKKHHSPYKKTNKNKHLNHGFNFSSVIMFVRKNLNIVWVWIRRQKMIVIGTTAVAVIAIAGVVLTNALTEDKPKFKELVVDVEASRESIVEVLSLDQIFSQKPFHIERQWSDIDVFQLMINGKCIGLFAQKEDAENILKTLKTKYTDEDSEVLDVNFSQKVSIDTVYQSVANDVSYDSLEDVLLYIERGTKVERKHRVKKGENYWIIAQMYGLQPEDLEVANPGQNPDTLQIDQEISLIVPEPLITVRTTEKIEYKEQIAFDTTYEKTPNLYKGETRIKINGKYGEKDVVATVVKENGREISKEILTESIIAEPSAKVVYTGTKNPPPRLGTGTFMHPTSRGGVTSEFGAPRRGGRRHTGIDVGIPTGTPVQAADGGTVISTGYGSSYGYFVSINHGGNMSTLYAHLSKISVQNGTQVYQGQTIGLSGNTGVSSGPHLHFEVRVRGVPQNPRNYISF